MFQVIFPMKSGTEVSKIKAVLPAGWTAKASGLDWSWIANKEDGYTVGLIKIMPDKIVITVDGRGNGEFFWRGFTLKYPELNPFDLRHGVLYRTSGGRNRWELDEFPKHSPQEILEDVSHYRENPQAYYVSYFLGDWHWREEIQVQTCRKINEDGSLGKDRGKLMFLMGSIENENDV